MHDLIRQILGTAGIIALLYVVIGADHAVAPTHPSATLGLLLIGAGLCLAMRRGRKATANRH